MSMHRTVARAGFEPARPKAPFLRRLRLPKFRQRAIPVGRERLELSRLAPRRSQRRAVTHYAIRPSDCPMGRRDPRTSRRPCRRIPLLRRRTPVAGRRREVGAANPATKWAREESNLHGRRPGILNAVRLPITPRAPRRRLPESNWRPSLFRATLYPVELKGPAPTHHNGQRSEQESNLRLS